MEISISKHIIVTPNDLVITSPNRPGMAINIPPAPEHTGYSATPQRCRSLNWSDNNRPYIPYMLCQDLFTSPLLSRLNVKFYRLPLELSLTGWRLATAMTESWLRLESILRLMYELLFARSGHYFPVDMMEPRFPSTYALTVYDTCQLSARKRAIRARNTFLPLLAYCSYAITLYTRNSDFSINDHWYTTLIQEGMHPPTADEIRKSELATFSLSRAGVIIPVTSSLTPNDLQRMVKAEVPVFFYWGTVFQPLQVKSNFLNKHKPTWNQIKSKRAMNHPWLVEEDYTWQYIPSSSPGPLAAIPHSVPPLPPHTLDDTAPLALSGPESYSGQQRCETWQQFMARREVLGAKIIDKETPAQTQRRKNLIEASNHGPSKASKVFVWEKNDDTGYRNRRRVVRSMAFETWTDYRPRHRRFDAVYNEWDLCSEFALEDQGSSDGGEYDSDFDDELTIPYATSSYVATLQKKSQAVPDVTHILETDINDMYYGFEAQFFVPLIYLENALEHRYGFLDKVSSLVDRTESDGQPLSDKEWLITCKNYAQRPLNNNPSSQYKSMVHCFTRRMLSPDFTSNLSTSPHYIWDLRTTPPNSMQTKMLISPLHIKHVHIDGKTMYEIKLKTPATHLEVRWRLVLEDPVTALQCIRENFGYSLKDVALGLARIGASFHMFKFYSIPQNPVQGCLNLPALGYRQQHYKPTVGDHARYVELRNAALQGTRCHAAITRGGIIWCLAVESLLPSIVINEDIEIDFLQYSGVQYHTSTNGQYCENSLTEADELMICGVYHVYTGKGEQTAHKSWWPKPSAWAVNGLNVGYWSVGCEQWYQERLRMIQEGKAELRNASEWTISLTFQRKTRLLIAHHKKAAEMFFAEQCTL